jgi:hypothetical protein
MKVIRKLPSFFLNLATLRLGGRNFRIRGAIRFESFAQATQIFNYRSTKYTRGRFQTRPYFLLCPSGPALNI